jgi:chlorite dismutase
LRFHIVPSRQLTGSIVLKRDATAGAPAGLGLPPPLVRYDENMSDTAAAMPATPLTLEGAWVLHQMLRFDWAAWRATRPEEREAILAGAQSAFATMTPQRTALFSLLGHKGDLLLIHFRPSLDELNQAQLEISRLGLADYFDVAHSYLSVIELGLYESSVKIFQSLLDQGLSPHTDEWNAAIKETLDRQRTAMHPRLYPEIPGARYVCFYPMDRRRGEQNNWYHLPIQTRQRLMGEHGETGRRYLGKVRQIISGSVGLDDWEWGVDLFSDDPLVFKHLIYEMRFDEVSALYAEFGEFFIGVRYQADQLAGLLPA